MKTFSEMFQMDVTAGEAYAFQREIAHRWEISGIIGVTGGYQGVVAVRLSGLLASKLLDKTGVEAASEEEREDILYGLVGEITNVVAAKTTNSLTEHVEIAPPLVVYGQNHSIAWPRTIPVICIPFVTSMGPFEVAVCFKYRPLVP